MTAPFATGTTRAAEAAFFVGNANQSGRNDAPPAQRITPEEA